MRRFVLVVLLMLLVVSAAPRAQLMRFTLVNKSNQDIYLALSGYEYEQQYPYLHLVGAGREPVEQEYTLVRDIYNASLNYCGLDEATDFVLPLVKSKFRYVVLPCNSKQENLGGDNVLKVSPFLWEPGSNFPYIVGEFEYDWEY